MVTVRPAELLELELLALDDEDGEDGEDGEDEDDEGPLVVPAGSFPVPPQAVRKRASASPAAYDRGTRNVIVVTKPSLNSAF
jgi:hypothetical protein